MTDTIDQTYRPSLLADFEGQDSIVDFLKIKVNTARKTGKTPGHMLFLGPSGTGKTTLALAFANELNTKLVKVMANNIATTNDFMNLVSGFTGNEVLFIDEIHMLSGKVQDGMLDFLESGKIITKYKGRERATYLNSFTVIGATTHWGNLREAFSQRFGYKGMFSLYSADKLADMAKDRALKAYGVHLDSFVAGQIARVSCGKARQMANLIDQLMEVAESSTPQSVKNTDINISMLVKLLKLLGLDPFIGLSAPSRAYLYSLFENEGVALGAEAIARMINQQDVTVRDMIEPSLMSRVSLPVYNAFAELVDTKNGELIKLTPRGRVITDTGVHYVQMCQRLQSQGWFQGERLG